MKTGRLKSDSSALRIPLIARLLTLAVGLCFGLASVAGAQTQVSGTIINQTWTSNNSPYIVVGNINVARLTIDPGVTVSFATNYSFEVDGVLRAQGTPNAPIVFMGTNGGWQGIYFNYSSPGSILANCVISNSISGGIQILDSNPRLFNCTITGNRTTGSGGGINVYNMDETGNLVFQNCRVIGNSCALNGGGISAALGTNCFLEIEGCVISQNIANPSVDGGSYAGGGVWLSGNCLLSECQISSNACYACAPERGTGNTYGGGLSSVAGMATLNNCIIHGNVAHTSWCGPFYVASAENSYGGGLYSSSSLSLTNCVTDNNSVFVQSGTASSYTTSGGGMDLTSTNVSIVNCTVAYNNLEGIATSSSAVQVMNSIVYFNNANGTQVSGTTNLTYCDVQNGVTGTGNINGNPIFLSTGDLIIVPGSPCINAGNPYAIYNNVCFPPSLGKKHNDIGAHGGPDVESHLSIVIWPPAEVFFYGGVPGYNYQIQASTNLLDWQSVEQFQITNLGDAAYFIESSTNTLPQRFYQLSLAP